MSSDKTPPNIPSDWDRNGLPAWSYFNNELLEAEKKLLFRQHWQLVCHENDLPNVGDFMTVDIVGERALILRDKTDHIRAFHNLCRHRGSRVLSVERGNCKHAITCPFHGWVYNLDGTLRGPAQPKSFPKLDKVEWGLKEVELSTWCGFVFIRFQAGPQPDITQVLRKFDDEVKQYELNKLLPSGDPFWQENVAANWKCVRDVDNEGYHVPLAHPGLHDLFGSHYYDEPLESGTSRSLGGFREGKNTLWSVKNYRSILSAKQTLDEAHKNAWLYIGVFPNIVFGFYPDSVIFYQEFPLENGKTSQRGASYRYAEENRQMRLSRYLSMRIDRLTSKEDEQLIQWSWEAAFSNAYDGVILSDLEYGVKSYHDQLRKFFPILGGPEPASGELDKENSKLLAKQGSTQIR